jgi:RNA polymerase sigma factor (sigma-70 family)
MTREACPPVEKTVNYDNRPGAKWKTYTWQQLDPAFARARQGDPESKELIFSCLRLRLLRMAEFRLSYDTEDVVQDALAVVHSSFSNIDSLGALFAFAKSVLRNKIGNAYQNRDRHSLHQLPVDSVKEPEYRTMEELDARELERIIGGCIQKLAQKPCPCHAILSGLKAGMTTDEISEGLGMSKARLKVWTFRCRKSLRQILSDEFEITL